MLYVLSGLYSNNVLQRVVRYLSVGCFCMCVSLALTFLVVALQFEHTSPILFECSSVVYVHLYVQVQHGTKITGKFTG